MGGFQSQGLVAYRSDCHGFCNGLPGQTFEINKMGDELDGGSDFKFPPNGDDDLGLLRIVGLQLQMAIEGFRRPRNIGKKYFVFFPFVDLLDFVSQFFIQVEIDRFQGQGFVQSSVDPDCFCDFLSLCSLEIYVLRVDLKGHSDQKREDYGFYGVVRIICVDFCPSRDPPTVTGCIDAQRDATLPTRGNGPVESDHRASSARRHFFYQERLISLVADFIRMFYHRALVDHFMIK